MISRFGRLLIGLPTADQCYFWPGQEHQGHLKSDRTYPYELFSTGPPRAIHILKMWMTGGQGGSTGIQGKITLNSWDPRFHRNSPTSQSPRRDTPEPNVLCGVLPFRNVPVGDRRATPGGLLPRIESDVVGWLGVRSRGTLFRSLFERKDSMARR